MAILQVQFESIGTSGQIPKFVYLDTDNLTSQLTVPGFLTPLSQGGAPLKETQMALVSSHPVAGSVVKTTDLYKVVRSGSAWSLAKSGGDSFGVEYDVRIFTSSGTYEAPQGLSAALIQIVGAGGGGGGAAGQGTGANTFGNCGQGGGAGGYQQKLFQAVSLGSSLPVQIGVGGLGGVGAANGASGGNSQIGALLLGGGGEGGSYSVAAAGNGSGGSWGGSGDINAYGGRGTPATLVEYSASRIWYSGNGGASFFGAGGDGDEFSGPGRDTDGSPGQSPGSGGAGALGVGSPKNGGKGADGIVIITQFF